jgi:Holliday junction resolvase RusA-like endonuclease
VCSTAYKQEDQSVDHTSLDLPDHLELVAVLDVEPIAKPRMTRRDKWAKRPCVLRYWDFCDELGLKIAELDKELYEPGELALVFVLPMPHSWSIKKRKKMLGQGHQQRPDLDNLVKAYKDAVFKEDSHVYKYPYMMKVWGETGAVIVAKEKKC